MTIPVMTHPLTQLLKSLKVFFDSSDSQVIQPSNQQVLEALCLDVSQISPLLTISKLLMLAIVFFVWTIAIVPFSLLQSSSLLPGFRGVFKD